MVGGAKARAELSGGAPRTPLPGSPFTVRISGGDTHGPACTREGVEPGRRARALPVAVAGRASRLRVQARDRHGNAMARGGEQFVARLAGISEVLSCPMTDNGDGTYHIQYCPTIVGEYALAVTLDTGHGPQHIEGSRFALAVTAAPASPTLCGVSGAGLCDTLAGVHTCFTVHGWDVYGNKAALEPADLRVRVEGHHGLEASPVCIVRRARDTSGKENPAALEVGFWPASGRPRAHPPTPLPLPPSPVGAQTACRTTERGTALGFCLCWGSPPPRPPRPRLCPSLP